MPTRRKSKEVTPEAERTASLPAGHNEPPPEERIEPFAVSIEIAAKMLSEPPLSRATIYRFVKSKQLDLVKFGTSSRITTKSIKRLVGEAA